MGLNTVKSPKHSFVQFNIPESVLDCGGAGYCNPIFDNEDYKFQIIVDADSKEDADILMGMDDSDIELWMLSGTGNTSSTAPIKLVKNFTADHELYFKKFRTGFKEVTLVWDNPMSGFKSHVACEVCFELAISISFPGSSELIYVSNCFKRICDPCYTSIIEYSCEEDAFDFRYCNVEDFENRIRISTYLTRPQFPEEGDVYVRSDGSYKMLYNVIEKEYEGLTDHLPEEAHEKFKTCLAHDSTWISSKNYEGGIRARRGSYDIEWVEFLDYPLGAANYKAVATPYLNRNNNCAVCEEPNLAPLPCQAEIEFTYQIIPDGPNSVLVSVNWSNPAGPPSGGYLWSNGGIVGGVKVYDQTDKPTMSPSLGINPSDNVTGDFFFEVRAVCEDDFEGEIYTLYYSITEEDYD